MRRFVEVYKGKWNSQIVAIKKFLVFLRPSLVETYKSELAILKDIEHENVVKMLGYCDRQREPFIVQEYMEGESLFEYLSSDVVSFKWSNALALTTGIVNGMKYLHDKSILHLDLKSMNILLSADHKKAKIADFGLSKVTQLTSTTVYNPGKENKAKGTTRWMAPEITQGKSPKKESDVWSFGCILVEIATRQLPFHTFINDSTVFTMLQKATAEIPINIPLSTPIVIATIINGCLNRNASSRLSFNSISNLLSQFKAEDLNKPIVKSTDNATEECIPTTTKLNSIVTQGKIEKAIAKKESEDALARVKLEEQVALLNSQMTSLRLSLAASQATSQSTTSSAIGTGGCCGGSNNSTPSYIIPTYLRTTIYQEPTYNRVSYQELTSNRASYQEPTSNRASYQEPTSNRASYQEPTSNRVSYQEPTSNRVSYQEPTNSSSSSSSRRASCTPSYHATDEKFISNGKANGRTVYEGSRGGRFIFTPSGNKRYI